MTTSEAPARLTRAGCYLRISSDPRDKKKGVTRQRQDTTDLCTAKGWNPAGFYVDNDRSASNGKQRPEWDRLLADVKAGDIDAIVVWNQDRGWRMMHELETLRRFFESLGRKILLSTTLIGDIDLYDPYGVHGAQTRTSASELETAVMKIRQRRAARDHAASGKPKWRKAFGYMPYTGDKEDDEGKREPDPVTAPLVAAAYKAALAGTSISDIARGLNKAGALGLTGREWTASTVSLFLRSPRNAGIRVHTHVENGKTVVDVIGKGTSGTWTPLVDESTWRAAQTMLNAPGRAPGRKTVRQHLLTGVLKCGKCGHHLSGMQTKTGGIAYRCKSSAALTNHGCGGVGVAAHHIEPLLYRVVGERLAEPDAEDLRKAEISDPVEAERIRTELTKLYGKRRQIGIDYAKDLLDGEQAKLASDIVNEGVAKLERLQDDQEMLRVFEDIRLGTPEAIEDVESLSPERFRAVVDVLMTPVILPVGKGGQVFDPDRLQENWKR